MIYITGDTHGDFRRFHQDGFPRRDMTRQDHVIVCGDFGALWDGGARDKRLLDLLDSLPFTLLFITGNHDNYDLLKTYRVSEWNGGKVQAVLPHVLHLMRGQVFTIEGKTFFTMGGAECHDIYTPVQDPADPHFRENCRELYERGAFFRIKGKSWWPEELPDDGEYAEGWKNLRAHGMQVDYILTHCAPREVQRLLIPRLCHGLYPENALTEILQQISERVTFREWFFGHYHREMTMGKYRLLYESIRPL